MAQRAGAGGRSALAQLALHNPHIWALCSAIASPSLLSSSPIRVNPKVAAKRWKSIKLQHDGREIRLRDWLDFRGQYTLFRRNVEDWNEGDEQARLLSMLPEA